jgi:hypothetical protein
VVVMIDKDPESGPDSSYHIFNETAGIAAPVDLYMAPLSLLF